MTIPVSAIAAMGLSAALGTGLFLGLLLLCRKRWGTLVPFWTGCASFVLFALVLEAAVHRIVLTAVPMILENTWLYALYGGLMAGFFEETGRYAAMTLLKKKYDRPETGLIYGAGHGGVEVLLTLVSTMGSYIVFSVLWNAGQIESVTKGMDEASREAILGILAQLSQSSAPALLLGVLERVSAVILHIALSVFVWKAVHGRFPLYLLAIVLHALFDMVAVILSRMGINLILLELLLLALALGTAYAAGNAGTADPCRQSND